MLVCYGVILLDILELTLLLVMVYGTLYHFGICQLTLFRFPCPQKLGRSYKGRDRTLTKVHIQ